MTITAGDRIEVTANTLGSPPRRGVVLSSTPAGGLRVRWDDGHETVFMPGSTCRVIDREPGADTVRLGCHVDVAVTEHEDECRAVASVMTARGVLHAEGVARRRPSDPKLPMVGEELALGRALGSLAEQLITAASGHMAEPPDERAHLLV